MNETIALIVENANLTFRIMKLENEDSVFLLELDKWYHDLTVFPEHLTDFLSWLHKYLDERLPKG